MLMVYILIYAFQPADEFLGLALDGYPIYGSMSSILGREVTESDLDECHGANLGNIGYAYYVTNVFPFSVGCFRGRPARSRPQSCGKTLTNYMQSRAPKLSAIGQM